MPTPNPPGVLRVTFKDTPEDLRGFILSLRALCDRHGAKMRVISSGDPNYMGQTPQYLDQGEQMAKTHALSLATQERKRAIFQAINDNASGTDRELTARALMPEHSSIQSTQKTLRDAYNAGEVARERIARKRGDPPQNQYYYRLTRRGQEWLKENPG